MFEYRIDGADRPTTQSSQEVWSLSGLQPLAPGALTPFSFSVLAELVNRAWYEHYSALDFTPKPRPRVVRRHAGRPYFNVTQSAKLEAEHAALPPMTYRIDGELFPVCGWEKPGFLGGLRTGRAQKRLSERIGELSAAYPDFLHRAENWYIKTGELRWTQADILQVMEEIERVGVQSFAAFLAARRQLEQGYNRLIVLTAERIPFPQNLNLINHAVRDVEGLIEARMVRAMLELAHSFEEDAAQRQWLLAGDFDAWETQLNGALRHSISDFLGQFGYRATGEGELAHPRWSENPAKLFSALATYVSEGARQPVALPANAHAQKLADAAGKGAKDVPGLLDDIRSALLLQSKALNATAYILGGTRRWALAAGREATTDGRLNDPEEVFFYELEEIKQMMTGEWNISAMEEIRATAARRRQEYAAERHMMPGDLLIGDAEAFPAVTGLPATEGRVSGPLRRNGQPHPPACNGAIIGAEQLDSGWSLLLPIAKGLISAYGTPMDPIAAAGRIWHTPMMVGVGPRYADLVDGAQTVLDLDEIVLDQ